MAINVSDNNPRINYTATSGQTVFTVPFEFFASTDLTVYVDGSVLSASAYTVTGGSGSTGSITTDSGQTAGAEIAIVRDVPLERTTDLTSTYSASSLNDQLDRIVTQVADLDDRVSRSISLNDYEVGVSLDLPAKASRLGKTVQFNSITGALEVGPSGNELTSIASIASEITALDGIKANITTVAGAITNVNSVGSNISSVTSVAGSISNVNTVNTNIANVNSVATSITDVNDVADSIDQVELVAGSISNVDTVALANSNISSIASNISNVNTVAGISANVTTVAGITAAISTVNSNATNINLVATNIDDVNDVANVVTKVTTVADNIANVNTVAPSVGYLSTVANNISNINTLAPISADITTVAGVASSVSSAAANAAAAESAKVAAQAAQAAAELAADNFDDTYLGSKSSDPVVDNDGDALTAGDLYFSTTDNNLKVYSGSAWQAAALDASGFVDVTGDTMTGNLLFGDGVEARFGTHGDLTLTHETNNSYIIASNSKPLSIRSNDIYFRDTANSNLYIDMVSSGGVDYRVRLYHSGTDVRLETTSTGISINGNATFGDNDKAIFGAGSDLQIYHDGFNSIIDDAGTGYLVLKTSGTGVAIQSSVHGNLLIAQETFTKLYNAGSEKLATTSTGIDVTGTITADGLTLQTSEDVISWASGNGIVQAPSSLYLRSSGTGNVLIQSDSKAIAKFENGGDISFYDSAGSSQSFYWDASAERLGIGTSSPVRQIHSHQSSGGSTNYALFTNTTTGSTSSDGIIVGLNATSDGYLWNYEAGNLVFGTSSAERMRLTSAGNVGIGTTSPNNTLSLEGSGTGLNINSTNDEVKKIAFENSGVLTGYIGSSTASPLRFLNGSATEYMRIDSSGNLGIGTTAPAAALHVSDTSNDLQARFGNLTAGLDPRIRFQGKNVADTNNRYADIQLDANNGIFTIYAPAGSTPGIKAINIDTSGNVGINTSSPQTIASGYGALTVGGTTGGGINFNSTGSAFGQIYGNNTNLVVSALGNRRIAFNTNGTERMRIDSSGNLLVGGTSVGESESFAAAASGSLTISRVSGSNRYMISFDNGGSNVGRITTSTTSTTYGTSSDYRLKTDAQPMTGATDRIKQLNPVNFEWIADGTRVDGFLAHEAQAVVPEAVTGAKDAMRDEEYEVTPAVTDDDGNVVTEAVMGTRSVPDYKGIDQSKLVPVLVATIQELEARITALENA